MKKNKIMLVVDLLFASILILTITFNKTIENIQRQITLLQERKQIIINEVVTGKVRVS